ncbi:uncharacterized protein DUF4410 [Trinickia symbiotica]|uniref:DUF4410 domain-containing protein n=1 Tax=Trinickia symbiotica TaxID=863227 RepID=A0A2N7X829_9BURK|nr:DUF4410 domain-containing protein [Trinickia symbiotica]PMS37741.1 DUF4410 domain-containing protein [Trinickia symbiotica]PPK44286.1 uncharacterized protein DUF4410 [Trinickia symbiotica]
MSMQNPSQQAVRHWKGAAVAALSASFVLLTGCAAPVTGVAHYPVDAREAPDIVYVRSFDVAPDQCLPASGQGQRQGLRLMSGGSAGVSQAACAAELRDSVADQIVSRLQSQGWRAMRSDSSVPAGTKALLVEGNFETVDAGNARRRVVVGLGAGKRELAAAVRLMYQPATGAAVPVQSFTAKADSGKAPGMAETGAMGAITHHLPIALAAGAALHVASERRHTTDTDAKKLADKIADQVQAAGTANNWPVHGRG